MRNFYKHRDLILIGFMRQKGGSILSIERNPPIFDTTHYYEKKVRKNEQKMFLIKFALHKLPVRQLQLLYKDNLTN